MHILITGCNNSEVEIMVNSLIILKSDVFLNTDNMNEYCLKAFHMVQGEENALMGYAGREFLGFRRVYEGKLAQVVKIYSKSTN
jgi:hypothetical protein